MSRLRSRAYDVYTAGRAIESFVDQLSNWYVRRNRRRFWKAAAVAAGRTFGVDAGGETIVFEPEDVLVESTSAEGYACAEEGGYLVGLDAALTEALEREGLARELVRTVQEARKQAGLDVSDRITLRIEGTPEVAAALETHRDYVMEETLAIDWGEAKWSPAYSVEHSLGDRQWAIGVARADMVR